MAYRDSTTNSGTSATPSVAVPAGVQIDDIVIISVQTDASTAAIDTADWPTGFTELEEVAQTADGGKAAIGWKRLTAADSGTYTFGNITTSAVWVCQAFAFSGRDTGNPPTFASTNNNTLNASPITATVPTVTALAGDDLLTVCAPDVRTSGAFNVYTSRPSGYTIAETMENGFTNLAGDYLDNASAGATGTKTYVYTTTINSSGWYAAHIRIPASTGGGASVTPGVASLTLSTFAPTVTASNHKSVTPGVASLTLSTFAPSVIINNIVTPGVASLTLTTFAPTISVSNNQSVTPGVLALTLSTFAPTVTASDHKTVTPSTLALTLTTYAPTVSVGANLTVTPSTLALILTTYAPTVSVSDNKSVTPSTASLTLTLSAPTVSTTANVAVTPGVLALVASLFAPTVTTGGSIVVTPGTASLTLTTFAPAGGATGGSGSTPTEYITTDGRLAIVLDNDLIYIA